VVAPYRRFGTVHLKMGPTVCPETSARNYALLRNNREERSSHLLRGRSLKPRIVLYCIVLYCILLSTSVGWCTDCKKQSYGYFELAVLFTLHSIDTWGTKWEIGVLYHEKHLQCSPVVLRVKKLKMWWSEHMTCTGKRNTTEIWKALLGTP